MDGPELKAYERFKEQAQTFRARCYHLEGELRVTGPELYRAYQKIDRLEQRNRTLSVENKSLRQKLADVTAPLKQKPKSPPPFVKGNVPEKTPSTPGRRAGHVAALRPMPEKIDVHRTVAVPIDTLGKSCRPHCATQLSEVEHHERTVEELVPSEVVTTCYHTTSGWCGHCRKQVESRAENQPPAADLPHAQLGLNALCAAMMMRACCRLPFRQITRLFLDLPGLKISPGAIVKQIKRVGKWLEKQYHRVVLPTRCAQEIRHRCVMRPDIHQTILLDRLKLKLPDRLKMPEM